MNINELRNKYKQILEEPESQNSQDQWEQAYSKMQQKRRKRILTESCAQNFHKNPNSNSKEATMLSLKEKLAQCIAHLSQKSEEATFLKQQNLKGIEQIKILQTQLQQMKKQIHSLEKEIVEEKVLNACHMKEKQEMQVMLHAASVDKQLIQKQIQYYKTEINQLKIDKRTSGKRFAAFEKELRLIQKTKTQNIHLKQDIKRLHLILNDNHQAHATLSQKIVGKHYLGRPYKEYQHWYPENLVGEVELFLKKTQVGYGNKEFMASLVKFIDKYCQSKRVEEGKRGGTGTGVGTTTGCSIYTQSQQKKQKKHARSISSHEMGQSSVRQTQPLAYSLSRNAPKPNSTLGFPTPSRKIALQDKYGTRSITLTRPPLAMNQQVTEMLQEFKSVVQRLLSEKEVKRSKVRKVVDEVAKAVGKAISSGQ